MSFLTCSSATHTPGKNLTWQVITDSEGNQQISVSPYTSKKGEGKGQERILLSHVTCMKPYLSQSHPRMQRSLFRGTALQRWCNLRQCLLHSGSCYWCGMDWTCRSNKKLPSQTERMSYTLHKTFNCNLLKFLDIIHMNGFGEGFWNVKLIFLVMKAFILVWKTI